MGRRVLLVEGQDDQHVLWAIFQTHTVPETFKVERADGIEQLLEAVPVWLKASNLERFAIVLDADEDIRSRWEQLKQRLIASGCADVPDAPSDGGTVAHIPDGPTIGLWIMPDNRLPGILESFLAFLIPDHDRLLPLVEAFLASIPEADRRCPPYRIPKARIHAWLAVQNEPGKPLGQAITARYLDARREVVAPFLDWIKAVFTD